MRKVRNLDGSTATLAVLVVACIGYVLVELQPTNVLATVGVIAFAAVLLAMLHGLRP